MKKIKLLSIALFAALLVIAPMSFGQTILTNTTLSASVTSDVTQFITVASATGVVANSTILWVDREAMSVEAVSGTALTVQRGASGTTAKPHASGALAFVVPVNLTTAWGWVPQGSCTRTNELALPRIYFSTGIISDCLGGQWVNGDATQTTRATFYRLESPTIGAVSNAAAIGTNSTVVAAELYCTEIRMPYSKLLTGLAPHIATTGATDNWIVALYDSAGNLVANSALTGALVGSANTWQATAFTKPYYVVGPGQYFGCMMSNGTAATLDTITTGKDDNILTFKSASAGTFGTLPSFTAPTTFHSVSGPYIYAY